MSARGGIGRLAQLFARVEQMRSLELLAATGAVAALDGRRAAERAAQADLLARHRLSFVAEDNIARASTAVARQENSRTQAWIALRRDEAEQARVETEEVVRESRIASKQLAAVAQRVRADEASAESRAEQALADDRFAARAHWLRLRQRG